MSKTKKKKKLSDKKLHGMKKEPKKLNAFEMHVNRKKFNVVGMKLKAERGLPGVSRSRAIQKRKVTLLQEYKWKDKKNAFLDRRIGEKDSAMTPEDKIIARFTAERAKFHSKKSLYNLGDGEELTHHGQSLTEIEKFDDPKSDDEYDDEQDGKLSADFVGEAHFGGGMLKKVDGESKSRKSLIDELIAESKKRKAEKQKLREEMLDLTQKLDSEWKELFPLVTCAKKGEKESDLEVKKDKKSVTYDILSKQLKFEARGKPMDRLKSEEEIAREEKGKLEALEKERIERMSGTEKKTTIKHRSADDIDDGFDIDDGQDFILSYDKDGLPTAFDGDSNFAGKRDPVLVENEDGDEGEFDGEDEEEEEEEEDKSEEEEGAEEGENEGKDDEEGCSSDEASDHLSDLKESDDSDIEIVGTDKKEQSKEKAKAPEKKKKSYVNDNSGKVEKDPQSPTENKGLGDSLPYTYDIPETYESFEKLVLLLDLPLQFVIIERMIKCNHPSLSNSNKENLKKLFVYLVQYLDDLVTLMSSKVNCFVALERLAPFLYDLTQWCPEFCSSCMVKVITEKYEQFLEEKKTYPDLSSLIYMKLVSLLFSTSDYRHRVATPTVLFMQHVLSSCRVTSSVELSAGLFVCTIALEFCSFSKRYIPEVCNFIGGVLRLCHPKDSKLPILLPFAVEDFEQFNLIVTNNTKSYSIEKLGLKEMKVEDKSDEFKVKAIRLTLQILSELCDHMGDKSGAILIFETFVPLLDSKCFSACILNEINTVRDKILAMKAKPLDRLVLERKRPRPLKMYEPRIEEVYSLKRYRTMGRAKQERAKLQQKYKREMKGALREIRRDNSFLTKLKLKEAKKSDIERHRKVREILDSVSQQTGEVRKLKRKK